MGEQIRVLRVLEYVGDRSRVEAQVAQSIHGERNCDGIGGKLTIRAATLGTYPEILDAGPVASVESWGDESQ